MDHCERCGEKEEEANVENYSVSIYQEAPADGVEIINSPVCFSFFDHIERLTVTARDEQLLMSLTAMGWGGCCCW